MNKIILYGDIKVNCYFIENNNQCYIIDPGSEKNKIINYIKKNNLNITGILLTHAHLDHIGALDLLDVPVYIHEQEYQVLEDDHKNCFTLFDKSKPFSLKDINIVKINENTSLDLGGKPIEVVHTPGHTIGGVCYKFGQDLYTGDTLFKGKVGRYDLPTGSLSLLKKSVVDLINRYDDNVNVYPAHGISSTIGDERRNNSYYLKWNKVLQYDTIAG